MSLFTDTTRIFIFNKVLKVSRLGTGSVDAGDDLECVEVRTMNSLDEFVSVLKEYFGYSFPEGTEWKHAALVW